MGPVVSERDAGDVLVVTRDDVKQLSGAGLIDEEFFCDAQDHKPPAWRHREGLCKCSHKVLLFEFLLLCL